MKNFLIKMYRVRPSIDKLTPYNILFFAICAVILWGFFMIAAIYVYDGVIWWRMLHIIVILICLQLAATAVIAYFEDKINNKDV